MEEGPGGDGGDGFVQNVVVMRHGDRIDHIQPLWVAQAERPWDPPLVDAGKVRAWTTGKKLRGIGFPIHRVIVSPFRRCLQTAAEAISALCAVVESGESGLVGMETSDGVVIDPSRVKVSIEYGLSEVFGRDAVLPSLAPEDGEWFPNISELEALLPAGTIDHSVELLYKTVPCWGESIVEAGKRYKQVFVALADKFPGENLLLVTHGEGVGVSVSSFMEGAHVLEVEYCAYSHLQRQISPNSSQACSRETFKVLTTNGQTGVSYTT